MQWARKILGLHMPFFALMNGLALVKFFDDFAVDVFDEIQNAGIKPR